MKSKKSSLSATQKEINMAIEHAEHALKSWRDLELEERFSIIKEYQKMLEEHLDALAAVISDEISKPLWESRQEVKSMINKIDASYSSYQDRCQTRTLQGATTTFKPHGVVAIFGTFNFPGHIANGHLIPALLAGNTVLYKPSDLSPRTAEKIMELWSKTSLPQGALNLIQGGDEVGKALASNKKIRGIYFTGSLRAGISINKACAEDPGKIIALELGGNNPLVIHNIKNYSKAAEIVIESAFVTAGQRCTCARRLIITTTVDQEKLIDQIKEKILKLPIATPDLKANPFMGPVVNEKAANQIRLEHKKLLAKGGVDLIPFTQDKAYPSLIYPCIVDVSKIKEHRDEEIFGPVLQLLQASSLEDAVAKANDTAYGLAASILTDNKEDYEYFRKHVNSGVINWNRPTTGASAYAPFGGYGNSGNHRPTAYFAADYASYPVASMECSSLEDYQSFIPKEIYHA